MNEQKWYDRAKRIMKKKKITMEEMGKHLGLKQSSMSMKLSGKRDSTIEDVETIANVMGISISELVESDSSFLINDDEKQYVEIFRAMSDAEKDVFTKFLHSLKK